MRKLALLAFAVASVLSCAPRVRVDAAGIRPVEVIAPVTFIANRVVRPPVRNGESPAPLPMDPSLMSPPTHSE